MEKSVIEQKSNDAMNLHHDLGNRVYQACLGFESAENMNLMSGNGHHIAQHISQAVQDYFRRRLSPEFKDKIPKMESLQLRLVHGWIRTGEDDGKEG